MKSGKGSLVKKILVIRFGAMGDLLHVSPSLAQLADHQPQAAIHVLTAPLYTPMVATMAGVTRCWSYDKKTGWPGLWQLAQQLKKEGFDAIINLHPALKTNLLCQYIGARLKATYRKQKLSGRGETIRHQERLHAAEDFNRPFQQLFPSLPDRPLIPRLLLPDEQARTPDEIRIAIIPGVGGKRGNRAWPPESFQRLIECLTQPGALHQPVRVLLIGGPEEIALGEQLCLSDHVENHCGPKGLLDTASLVQTCQLAIGGDTGPTHLAASLGVPMISLFGPTSLARTGPLGEQAFTHLTPEESLGCWPCELATCPLPGGQHEACMKQITVESVFKACQEMLQPAVMAG